MTASFPTTPVDAAVALLQHLQRIAGDRVIAIPPEESAMAMIMDLSSATSIDQQRPNTSDVAATPPGPPQHNFQIKIPLPVKPTDMFGGEETFIAAQSLEELYQRIHTCTKCSLGYTRTKFVFGTGNPHADIVLIGEAPGADEDAQGEPFVGRAGQLLTKILAAINLTRQEVYICNILKCRPPNNRRPLPSEVEQCEPYLYKQLQLINPPFIVALGLTAAETLLRRKLKMNQARGRWYDFFGARLLVTYHPAALLRNPELKRDTWEDVKRLRRAYDAYLSSGILPDLNQVDV